MCSYQRINGSNYDMNFTENWEEGLWANVSTTSSNTYAFQDSNEDTTTYSSTNDVYKSQEYQLQVSAAYQNAESSSNLSPAWDGASLDFPETHTNMSTYFSTFNPTYQFQDVSMQDDPVKNITMAKTSNFSRGLHQARINLVPTGNGNFKAIVKRKRKRTVFTTEQLQVLEEVYSKKPYVTRDERQILVQQLQVNDKSVKIWFQNRRLKNKRGEDHDIQEDNQTSILDRLDTVESRIKEYTDEFGYVTLDDAIMNELINVIDDYFMTNPSPVKTDIENSPIYEPISPASTSENSCEENVSTWQHNESNDIVQELIDIESIIAM